MSEGASKKVTVLQRQQAESNASIKQLKNRNMQLQKSNNELIQKSNEFKMNMTKYTLDIKELRDERCKLQTAVVELRL